MSECTMPECQTTAGCFCRRVGIVSDYVAPFVPSVADAYYNGVIAQKDAKIEQLERELAELRSGIKRLSDEEELLAETTDGEAFTLGSIAAKLAATEVELSEARELRAILEGHLSAAIDDYNEARSNAFEEAATELDEYAVAAISLRGTDEDPDRRAAHLAQSYAFKSAATALRAKAQPHSETRQEQR